MTLHVIVNKDDEVIGYKHRDEIVRGDIGRVSALWLQNTRGDVLIAQRAFTKKFSPGKWGPAVAGTVEQDEDYDTNITKEIAEEIGLTVRAEELVKGVKEYVDGTQHDIFVQWYFLERDIPIGQFVYPQEEVAALRYIPLQELITWAHEKPEDFSAGFRTMVLKFQEKGVKIALGV